MPKTKETTSPLTYDENGQIHGCILVYGKLSVPKRKDYYEHGHLIKTQKISPKGRILEEKGQSYQLCFYKGRVYKSVEKDGYTIGIEYRAKTEDTQKEYQKSGENPNFADHYKKMSVDIWEPSGKTTRVQFDSSWTSGSADIEEDKIEILNSNIDMVKETSMSCFDRRTSMRQKIQNGLQHNALRQSVNATLIEIDSENISKQAKQIAKRKIVESYRLIYPKKNHTR